jgi:hypothetical protein
MQSTTQKKLCIELGAMGVMGGPVRSAKLSAVVRTSSRAKLDMTAVDRIRSSSETGAALALDLGVSEQVISRVRSHQAWRNYSSPFAGLGALA